MTAGGCAGNGEGMNTACIATVAALAVALLVPVSAPAASAASPVSASNIITTATYAPAGLVAEVKSACKRTVSKQQAKKWKTLKTGAVSPKARWINRALEVSSSKTYTPQTAKAVRSFERAVKVKANGAVSARDWCLLKALAKVKGPGQGGNGNGGTTPGTDSPFNTGTIDWGGYGDSSPKDTLRELRSVETILSVWVENSTTPSKTSKWHASGTRVEEVFMAHATRLLSETQSAIASLQADIGTEREAASWKGALGVWHKARLFRYASFQAWTEGWLSGTLSTFMDIGLLEGGPAYAYDTQMAQFRATRDAYAASTNVDPELLQDTDRYLAWAETHLSSTLTEVEDHLVAWLNASAEGENALIAASEEFLSIAESADGRVQYACYMPGWFRMLGYGADPRESGRVAP